MRRRPLHHVFLSSALFIIAPISCVGSSEQPASTEEAADEVAAVEPAAVPQVLAASDLGLPDEVIPPEDEPQAPSDPTTEPEPENPDGVNGGLPERPEEAGDDFTGLGDTAVPVPAEEQLLDAELDEDNTLPAL